VAEPNPWLMAAVGAGAAAALGGLAWITRQLIQRQLRPALVPVKADDEGE